MRGIDNLNVIWLWFFRISNIKVRLAHEEVGHPPDEDRSLSCTTSRELASREPKKNHNFIEPTFKEH